jgi:hypothetical protein
MFKSVGAGIASIIALLALVFGLGYYGLQSYGFFAPRYTAIDNKVFHESQQYTDGKQGDLEQYEEDYNATGATQKQKDMIRSMVRHDFAAYNGPLTPELQDFLTQMRGDQ